MDVMGIEKSMEPRSIVPIKAPQGGVITEHRVREGMYVTPADAMFTIVDLSEVWVMVDIFEHQIAVGETRVARRDLGFELEGRAVAAHDRLEVEVAANLELVFEYAPKTEVAECLRKLTTVLWRRAGAAAKNRRR